MKKYLVLSAVGTDRVGIVRDLAKAIADVGCGVADSRVAVLGSECTVMLLACGSWNAIAKLENQALALSKKLDLVINAHRTEERAPREDMLSYVVDVATLDSPAVVTELADFFASRQINIDEMSTWAYTAVHTGAGMLSISMNISIPSDLHVGRLRDEFTDFCDTLNLDATLEPARR
ncbi:MAG: glycine cleavage system protein R [Gammaproteobacteria bacterium]|nr:glycine cleavage system protein R [Gammaproteobacteria bacterium]